MPHVAAPPVRSCWQVKRNPSSSPTLYLSLRLYIHFYPLFSPFLTSPIPLTFPIPSDTRTAPHTALLQAYTSLHPHVLALVVLVRAFARGQELVDIGTPEGDGHGVSSSSSTSTSASSSNSSVGASSGGNGSGLLSSYTWSILALHFLLHEHYVPNLHCPQDDGNHDSSDNINNNNNNKNNSSNSNTTSSSSLLQSLSTMSSEQAVIALQQPARVQGRDPVTYLTRLEETTPLALLRDMFQVGDDLPYYASYQYGSYPL